MSSIELSEAKIRPIRTWSPDLAMSIRDDGSILIWREDPLEAYPVKVADVIDHWADTSPEAIWMAQREGKQWKCVSYRELGESVRRVGQFLLDLELSVERPLVILSGNSLEHAIVALGAQYVGIPSAAVSPAYSLLSSDYGKLRSIDEQITPGAIFVQQAEAYENAVNLVFDTTQTLISVSGQISGRQCYSWQQVMATEVTDAVDVSRDAVIPDTILKFLFTSGTTGSPKAVIQTNRMICANQIMVRDAFAFMKDQPPIICDWAPWSHTASGNKVFYMSLFNGGSYYIDGGKPTPKGIEETIRNLKEISPTWYFNVPIGFESLVEAMSCDDELRESFFCDLQMIMYAGAGMAEHTWRNLERLSVKTLGMRVRIVTGLGATETSPFSMQCVEPQQKPGNVGVPAPGITLKLVPHEGKYEARLKGPNITPGYWRAEQLTREAFDEEGFYCLGDALRFAEEGNASAGFFFDGRISENFKLSTGTWVAVGAIRAQLNDQLGGLASDVVLVGENQDCLAALLVPSFSDLSKIAPAGTARNALIMNLDVRRVTAQRLSAHIAASTGSATRVTRVMFLEEPLSLDKGEVTDKGSVNQRAVLRQRADLVAALYTDDPRVIQASE